MARFRDHRPEKIKNPLNRQEDKIFPMLFNIQIHYFPKLNQAGIYLSNKYIASNIELPIYELKKVHYKIFIEFNLKNITLDIDNANKAFFHHIRRIKFDKSNCRFNNNNICLSWIDCDFRKWNHELNYPICTKET